MSWPPTSDLGYRNNLLWPLPGSLVKYVGGEGQDTALRGRGLWPWILISRDTLDPFPRDTQKSLLAQPELQLNPFGRGGPLCASVQVLPRPTWGAGLASAFSVSGRKSQRRGRGVTGMASKGQGWQWVARGTAGSLCLRWTLQ